MNDTLKTLLERRSIRKYKPEQITDEQLQDILTAGMFAPNGNGAQSAVMVVAQEPQMVKRISALVAKAKGKAEGTDAFFGAPTVVVVFSDSERGTFVEDGSLVMGNLMNAAYSVGVDSCWINRARQAFEYDDGKTLMQKWGLSEQYRGIGCCILGYRDCEYPAPKPRKDGYIIKA